jgi:hypothetical protein
MNSSEIVFMCEATRFSPDSSRSARLSKKMAAREGCQLDPAWYADDQETKRKFDELERRHREDRESE